MQLDAPAPKDLGSRPLVPDDDSPLLLRAQSGDMAAFESLVERHQARVYGLAVRMLNSEADAAEVTQEAFLAAYRNLSNFRGDSAFGSWVHRIAANGALMKLRHRKVSHQVEESMEEPHFNERGSLVDSVASWSPDAEEQVLDAELRRALEEAAAALGEEYRQVFLLRDIEGLSYEEIAQATGQTVPSVKSRLHRARLSMRSAIDRFYQEREG